MRYRMFVIVIFCFICLFFIPLIASADSPDIYEADDTSEESSLILPYDTTQYHNFHQIGDEDWLRINGNSGITYVINTMSQNPNFKPVIELYDADGITLSKYQNVADIESNALKWFSEADGLFYVRIRNSDPNIYGKELAYQVWLESYAPDKYDGDNAVEWANVIVPGDAAQEHNFHAPGDVDWVKFYGIAGETYTIEAKVVGGNADVIVELYNPDGTTLLRVQNDPAEPAADETLNWYCAEDNVYYVRIINSDTEAYGKGMEYEVSIARSAVAPTISGTVEGRVTDIYSGSPIEGVRIKTGADTGTLSSDNGEYLIVLHPPGNYSITCEVSEYELFEDTIIVLEGESVVKDVRMMPKAGKVAMPLFFPTQGIYPLTQKIEISCDTLDAIIYYTVDGSEPTELSQVCSMPIIVSESTFFKAKAYKKNWKPSDTATGDYVITGKVEMPLFSPEPGTYTVRQMVALSCTTPDAVIYYTLNGSEPDRDSKVYATLISISETTIIKAKALKADWLESDTITGSYLITGTVATPVFSPESGTYPTAQNIEMFCATPEAAIYFTTDGTEPDEDSTLYTTPLFVSSDMLIKAKALKKNWNVSSTATGIYTITGTIAPPLFSPEPGIYATPQNVGLSCNTAEAMIRYTTDGSEPDENSASYTTPINVSSGITIKAKAFKPDWIPSPTATGIYTITGTIAAPFFSPEPGIYATPQDVGLSCNTAEAVVRYTTDGSEPDENSASYTTPINVSSGITIKAKAFKPDWIASPTATGIYTITGTIAAPFFSPEPGIYATPQDVGLSCNTAEAVVRYTTDGSEPDENSTIYTTLIPVSSGMTIKAKAFKPDWIASPTVTGTYAITGTVSSPTFSPVPGTYTATQFVGLFSATSGASVHYTTDGSDPEEYSRLYTEPIPVSSTTTIKARAFKTDWAASNLESATYTIIQTVETPIFSPEPGLYTQAQQIELFCATLDAAIYYTTDESDPTEDSLIYTTPILVSETTIIKAKAFKTGWFSSNIATADYTITGTVENPTFSLPSDVYTTPQRVMLSCAAPGVSIHYTVDGNEPTEESPVCESGISVNKTLTLKAKAFRDMWQPSETVTRHYIIAETEHSDSGGGGCFLNTVSEP